MKPPVALLILLGGTGCAHRVVDVSVRGVMVGPADWDAMGVAQQAPPGAVATMLGLNPFAAAAGAVLLPAALGSLAPPDPSGSVTLACDGPLSGQVRSLPQRSNAYMAVWQPSEVAFYGVPWNRRASLLVHVVDYDPMNQDDEVASVEVDNAMLRAALRDGKVRTIDFTQQTQNALVWLAVEVTRPVRTGGE